MKDDDKTPTDKQDTLELILASVQRTEQEARDTKLFAERSHDVSLQMFQEHKAVRGVVKTIQRRRWAPALVSIAAALISLACAYAAIK